MSLGQDFADAIHKLGRDSELPSIMAAAALVAPLHAPEPYPDVEIIRDISYGPDERHRLDVFRAAGHAGEPRPVFVFVHGGGFVGGDKATPGRPFYDNVMLWAVKNGFLGINITYRLAPDHPFPAGSDDVSAAIDWARAHAAEHGGDPGRVFVSGTSAGAVHVAGYLANKAYGAEEKVKGAILLSCLFDLTKAEKNPMRDAYFGEDESALAGMSTLKGMVETKVPVLLTLAEYDPIDFERQTLAYINAYFDARGEWPNVIRVMGHNHFTTGWHLNTSDEWMGEQMARFMKQAGA